MNTKTTAATAEAEIRELVGRWLEAVRAKDVNEVMSHYAADILTFDISPPRVQGDRRLPEELGMVAADVPRARGLRDSRPGHYGK